jgi:hypothetical protein
MFKKFQTGYQIAKTVASPIKQAAQKIKSTFTKPKTDQVSKYRKRALKMTKEATAKVGKDTKAAESRIGKEEAQKIGRETKSKMVKDFLKYNRDLKAKGGPVDKKKKKKKFPDLTGDGKITFADVLKGRGVINGKKKKKKKKVI